MREAFPCYITVHAKEHAARATHCCAGRVRQCLLKNYALHTPAKVELLGALVLTARCMTAQGMA